jgi:hypothetical protein
MNVDTEHVLKKVRTVKNVGESGELVQKATRILTHNEMVGMKNEVNQIQGVLNPEHPALNQGIDAVAKARLTSRKRYIEKSLEESAPPEQLPAQTKDALYARQKVLEEQIREGMPPAEVMRRNPAGAVDWHVKWERTQKNAILEWKNIVRMLSPGDDSKDLANVERLRPSMLQRGGPSTFAADAQITGHVSYGHISDDRWADTFNTLHAVNSPYARAVERETTEQPKDTTDQYAEIAAAKEAENEQLKAKLAEYEKQLATKEDKKAMIAAARSLRMKKMHEAKRAAKEAAKAARMPQAQSESGVA